MRNVGILSLKISYTSFLPCVSVLNTHLKPRKTLYKCHTEEQKENIHSVYRHTFRNTWLHNIHGIKKMVINIKLKQPQIIQNSSNMLEKRRVSESAFELNSRFKLFKSNCRSLSLFGTNFGYFCPFSKQFFMFSDCFLIFSYW